MKVMVVDDSSDIRDLVSMVVVRAGWEVVGTAANGVECLERVNEADPDLVLLDISMPVMDGLVALPMLRERRPATTVVMLSAFPASAMEQRAMDAGAHGYVEKTNVVRDLAPAVQQIIGQD